MTGAIDAAGQELSAAAQAELAALGMLDGAPVPPGVRRAGSPAVEKRAVHAPHVLNEAFHYPRPSSFSRGVRVELPGVSLLLLSGTASVDENGATAHPGDFAAQCLRTYRNLTALLAAEGATWHDVVRTTVYLKDIDRDYEAFNRIRTSFLAFAGVDPLPASTGIQARLCRPDLLVEIEAMAVLPREPLR